MISQVLPVFLFGLVAFSVPTIIAALVGDYAGPGEMATAFGFVTFIFGILLARLAAAATAQK